MWVVGDAAVSPSSSLLSKADLLELFQAARRLEHCFGGPQEIDHGWGTAALFVLGGELAMMDGVASRFDTVLLGDARPLRVSGTAEVLLIGFEALA